MLQVPPILSEVNIVSVFVRLSLALLFGGIIGLDRGRKRRAAGFRTYMLVCLGSTLVMLTNQYVSQTMGVSDPVRLGAQVISGIGFLGAGTIIVTGHYQVIGLTTAAGLWACACMGLAIGIGFYEGAIVATVFIVVILMSMHRLDSLVAARSQVLEIYVELGGGCTLNSLLQTLGERELKVDYMEVVKPRPGGEAESAALITLRLRHANQKPEVIGFIGGLEGVRVIEEI